MLMNFVWDNPEWLLFALVIGYVGWKIILHGGYRGAMFGAAIERPLGEVSGTGSPVGSNIVKIYRLSRESEGRAVGLEVRRTSILGYDMNGMAMSAAAARELSELLDRGADTFDIDNRRSLGTVRGTKSGVVKIRALGRASRTRAIELELSDGGFLDFETFPVTLSVPAARALSKLLTEATRGRPDP